MAIKRMKDFGKDLWLMRFIPVTLSLPRRSLAEGVTKAGDSPPAAPK